VVADSFLWLNYAGMRANPRANEGTGRQWNRPDIEANRLAISRRQLSNWMRDGSIPFVKRGRVILFDPTAVDAALARFETVEVTR
jgi:excisionase family DNA binding protein